MAASPSESDVGGAAGPVSGIGVPSETDVDRHRGRSDRRQHRLPARQALRSARGHHRCPGAGRRHLRPNVRPDPPALLQRADGASSPNGASTASRTGIRWWASATPVTPASATCCWWSKTSSTGCATTSTSASSLGVSTPASSSGDEITAIEPLVNAEGLCGWCLRTRGRLHRRHQDGAELACTAATASPAPTVLAPVAVEADHDLGRQP